MGKKKQKGDYNDSLDGEKLRDNTDIRTTLDSTTTSATSDPISTKPFSQRKSVSPPPTRQSQTQSQRHTQGKSKPSKKPGGPKKPPLTHFLCLPFITPSSQPTLDSGLKRLEEDVRRSGVVSEKAIRPVGTLHLTLGVMSLDDDALSKAGECLSSLELPTILARGIKGREEVEGECGKEYGGGLVIDLKGLVPMQSKQRTSILYAEPVDAGSAEGKTEQLYAFASSLKSRFEDEGFMVKEDRKLRLHATIINTVYAKPKGGGGARKGKKSSQVPDVEKRGAEPVERETKDAEAEPSTAPPEPSTSEPHVPDHSEVHNPNSKSWMRFDATELVEQYKDFTWIEGFRIDRVQICKMGAKKILDEQGEVVDEKYEVVFEKRV